MRLPKRKKNIFFNWRSWYKRTTYRSDIFNNLVISFSRSFSSYFIENTIQHDRKWALTKTILMISWHHYFYLYFSFNFQFIFMPLINANYIKILFCTYRCVQSATFVWFWVYFFLILIDECRCIDKTLKNRARIECSVVVSCVIVLIHRQMKWYCNVNTVIVATQRKRKT